MEMSRDVAQTREARCRYDARQVSESTFAKSKVDLVAAAQCIALVGWFGCTGIVNSPVRAPVSFVQEVDQYPCLYYNKKVLHAAIVRYEQCPGRGTSVSQLWIPIAMEAMAILDIDDLIPPLVAGRVLVVL
ncbi:hypothetical protein AK812_SmicGene9229 [Symbiodinium microadriaticum]|uniref:Uncharacterized protein n=1 Tax=Symbiodinium microadriaticum TaxID=2951 RepID=A0A1Q9EIV1_SYMMI|nr:hypothetical protein AK812_SmicGene9229 [Symbiodinium microadriaticum]